MPSNLLYEPLGLTLGEFITVPFYASLNEFRKRLKWEEMWNCEIDGQLAMC